MDPSLKLVLEEIQRSKEEFVPICEWSDLDDDFRFGKSKDEIEAVLSTIEKMYGFAKLDMGASGNDCCSCVGLLDPVTNIRFNYLFSSYLVLPADRGGREIEDMAQRSLDGLIAFLTCLFPYLPDAEALAYINAASADLVGAAVLIMNRRALTFSSFITNEAVEIALRSAAVAAKHPDPEGFVRGWKLASLNPEILTSELQSHKVEFATLIHLNRLLRGTPTDLGFANLWELTRYRLPSLKSRSLPSARGAMKRILLSIIHGYYLKALAVLPKQELSDRYHRSLLIGGHCYGPLDPVSNIIVNTIWYDQTFPARKVQPLKMISTDCLWRIAARSLYGLVSFLCNRNKVLTPDQALQRLLLVRANLTAADSRGLRDDDKKIELKGTTVLEAYFAAAKSARHPSAVLQKEFLGTPNSVRNLQVMSEMLSVGDGCTLTKEKIDCLLVLFRCPSSVGMAYPQQEVQPRKLSQSTYIQTSHAEKRFWCKHERVRAKVEDALHKFNETTVRKYSLCWNMIWIPNVSPMGTPGGPTVRITLFSGFVSVSNSS